MDAAWGDGFMWVKVIGRLRLRVARLDLPIPAEDAAEPVSVATGSKMVRRFEQLKPHQKEQCWQFLCGSCVMAGYGFNPGASDEEDFGKWSVEEIQKALRYGEKQ